MRVLCVSETFEENRGNDYLVNQLKDQFGFEVIYTKIRPDRHTIVSRVLRKLGFERDTDDINNRLLSELSRKIFTAIFIVKGNRIKRRTLRLIKHNYPHLKIFGWSGDNMTKWHNATIDFKRTLPLYTHFFSVNIPSYKRVVNGLTINFTFLDKCADDNAHVYRNHKITRDYNILFIGSYELDRAKLLNKIASRGHEINVFGSHWQKCKIKLNKNIIIHYHELTGSDYADAIYSSKITLGFLRKQNEDTQTSRTFEIPACKGFMLMERTYDHSRLFIEGREAEFFNGHSELLHKVELYLKNSNLRNTIAKNGYQKIINSRYLYSDMSQRIVRQIVFYHSLS